MLHVQHAAGDFTIHNGEHIGLAGDRHKAPGVRAVFHRLDFVAFQHQAFSLVFDVVSTAARRDKAKDSGGLIVIAIDGHIAQHAAFSYGKGLVGIPVPAALHLYIGVAGHGIHAILAQERSRVKEEDAAILRLKGKKFRGQAGIQTDLRPAGFASDGNGNLPLGAVGQGQRTSEGISQRSGKAIENHGLHHHRVVKAENGFIAGTHNAAQQLRHLAEAAFRRRNIGVQGAVLRRIDNEISIELQFAEAGAISGT